MERKALERLVSALMDEEHAADRAEAVENALAMAQVALWGEGELDEEDLHKNLDALSVDLMVGKLDREELSIHRHMVKWTTEDDEEDTKVQIICTSNPIVASIIDHTVKQALRPAGPYDLN